MRIFKVSTTGINAASKEETGKWSHVIVEMPDQEEGGVRWSVHACEESIIAAAAKIKRERELRAMPDREYEVTVRVKVTDKLTEEAIRHVQEEMDALIRCGELKASEAKVYNARPADGQP